MWFLRKFRHRRITYLYYIFGVYPKPNTAQLHLSELTGTARLPEMQKIRTTGFFFENWLHWQFEAEKKFLQTAVLGYIFIYVRIKH